MNLEDLTPEQNFERSEVLCYQRLEEKKELQTTTLFTRCLEWYHSKKKFNYSSKYEEFIYILEYFIEKALPDTLAEDWNIIEFEGDRNLIENVNDLDVEKESFRCICNQSIKNFYYVQYIPLNYTFRVGVDCIRKRIPELYEKIKDFEIKQRKKIKQCANKIFTFGKYEDQKYKVAYKDEIYAKWLVFKKIFLSEKYYDEYAHKYFSLRLKI